MNGIIHWPIVLSLSRDIAEDVLEHCPSLHALAGAYSEAVRLPLFSCTFQTALVGAPLYNPSPFYDAITSDQSLCRGGGAR